MALLAKWINPTSSENIFLLTRSNFRIRLKIGLVFQNSIVWSQFQYLNVIDGHRSSYRLKKYSTQVSSVDCVDIICDFHTVACEPMQTFLSAVFFFYLLDDIIFDLRKIYVLIHISLKLTSRAKQKKLRKIYGAGLVNLCNRIQKRVPIFISQI